jgi:hypothetical protein
MPKRKKRNLIRPVVMRKARVLLEPPREPPNLLVSVRLEREGEATSGELIDLDDANEVPLPDDSHLQVEGSTQRRSSRRLPKRSRRDEDFVDNQ